MTNREIEYDPGFASKLKKLSRRHRGLRESVDTRIAEIASGEDARQVCTLIRRLMSHSRDQSPVKDCLQVPIKLTRPSPQG